MDSVISLLGMLEMYSGDHNRNLYLHVTDVETGWIYNLVTGVWDPPVQWKDK